MWQGVGTSPLVEFLKKVFSKCFPGFFFAALCCFVGLWEDAGELLKGILRILPEDLELLLLSFHSPDKFGHEGYVMEDGNVFPRD